MTHIGKNIKKIRNVKGLSQQSFADLFSLTRGNISSYEESRAEPKIEVMLKIANYFGIPLSDLIEKDLSVNELLHYNANLVVETERLKLTQQLVKVPYVPVLYFNDFIQQYHDDSFISSLPHIVVPSSAKFRLIAIEIENEDMLPHGLNINKGDIVIFENVVKENIHRIEGKLGMSVNNEHIRWGIYGTVNGKMLMHLNEWVEYDFDIESDTQYWMLRAIYKQAL